MKRLIVAIAAAIVLLAGNAISYILRPLGENFHVLASVLQATFDLAPFLAAIYAMRLHGRKSGQGRILWLMAIGIACWFLADAIWAIYDIFFTQSPTVSLADPVWFIGYGLFFYTISLIGASSPSALSAKSKALLTLGSLAVVAFTAWLVVPALAGDGSLLEKAVAASYNILDCAILIALGVAIVRVQQSRFASAYIGIFISFVVMSLADILYTLYFKNYQSGDWYDLLWAGSNLLLALSFVYYRARMELLLEKPWSPPSSGSPGPAA